MRVVCPYCADPTVVDPRDPRCASCHARIDLDAIGRPFVPWATRAAQAGALLVGAAGVLLAAAHLAGVELSWRAPLVDGRRAELAPPADACVEGELVVEVVLGEARTTCRSTRVDPPVGPVPPRPGDLWQQVCFRTMDCRAACPAQRRRGPGGLDWSDECTRDFLARHAQEVDAGVVEPVAARADRGRASGSTQPAGVASSPQPAPTCVSEPCRTACRRGPVSTWRACAAAFEAGCMDPTREPRAGFDCGRFRVRAVAFSCDDPLCERMCGQYQGDEQQACANAFAAGCFTDPQASDAVCGPFRGNFTQ